VRRPKPTKHQAERLRAILDRPGARVLVLGIGRHGSGTAACRYLARLGADITVSDDDPQQLRRLHRLIRTGRCPPVRVVEPRDAEPLRCELVVTAPAVRPTHPLLRTATEHGIPITTEAALFLLQCPARCIGITGTNGKSTTALALYRMLRAAGRRAWLGGNIGRPLIDQLPRIQHDDIVVLELSSFQLHWLDQLAFSPAAAIITSLAEDHTAWHGCRAAYVRAKRTIVRYQQSSDWYVLNVDDAALRTWHAAGQRLEVGANATFPGTRTSAEGIEWSLGIGRGRLPWPVAARWLPAVYRHNLALAATAALALGADRAVVERILSRPRLLPHRMSVVDVIDGVTFIDDSAATTPQAAIAAVRRFGSSGLWVIAGGDDKGLELTPLAQALAEYANGVALVGRTAAALYTELLERGCRAVVMPDLEEALYWCWRSAGPGHCVLLSPGCASTDRFVDYRERGACFRAAVRRLRLHAAAPEA